MNEPVENRLQSVLHTCSYVPEEIIMAMGYQPRRFLPESCLEDAYVHPDTCGYVKSVLNAGIEGATSGAAGIVIANSCDAMRKLYDLWTEYVPSTPAFFLDVPRRANADAIAFFASELRKLAETMERELPGATMSEERLGEAIRTCNEVRSLMGDVFRSQRGARGVEVFDLCLAGAGSTKTEFAAEIRRLLAGPGEADGDRKGPRILLTGSIVNRPDVVAEIENAGGRVVVLDTSIGLRHYRDLVEEDAPDAMLALARRYLTRPPCARMQGFEKRFEYLEKAARDAGADGVVMCSLKFCDVSLYDAPMMSRRFGELGTPFLWIEGDYGLADPDQTKSRIAAFLEVNW